MVNIYILCLLYYTLCMSICIALNLRIFLHGWYVLMRNQSCYWVPWFCRTGRGCPKAYSAPVAQTSSGLSQTAAEEKNQLSETKYLFYLSVFMPLKGNSDTWKPLRFLKSCMRKKGFYVRHYCSYNIIHFHVTLHSFWCPSSFFEVVLVVWK